ncbi:phage exclusion protein Lit family protein [Rhizobium laguerreae]|uniref:phage exclusion protein Lit family protein n=1 Tax=Rhizobium laguerreae TaxID=1076926 RepID=UPI001C929A27|nr:phage exclusion protein Lit family protein [Rhizobium laguerreae]MBY3504006.1 hypothetical protein [Rhizobium laguerreae]
MDISKDVDGLLQGVIPERFGELARDWGTGSDRVRLLPPSSFHIQAQYGVIQVTEPFLKLMWLMGFAVWKGVQANAGWFMVLEYAGRQFDPIEQASLPGQKDLDNRFSKAVSDAKAMLAVFSVEDFRWPDDVPHPGPGARSGSLEQESAFDLVLMSGAYVFLHEIKHCLIFRAEEDENRTLDAVAEEYVCDEYARGMMLDRICEYCAATGEPASLVGAKRMMGIIFATMTILTVTPRPVWSNSSGHPPVKERVNIVLRAVIEPAPVWFWPTVAGILAAFARFHNLLSAPIAFSSSRELALQICELFDSQTS